MSVLIDTSVWSLGFRRKRRDLSPDELITYYEWERLLTTGQAAIIGPVRQEVLSGVSSAQIFESLKQRLTSLTDLEINTHTFTLAAEFYNTSRRHGIIPEHIDMTICAAAHLHHTPIFTTDPDFKRYAKHLPISLHPK